MKKYILFLGFFISPLLIKSNQTYEFKKRGKITLSSHPYSSGIKASWYGPRFHGKKTANGQIFNMHALTAAHRKLPFGTRVKVVNLKNKKEVIVTINDRGPYAKKRKLDLSRFAFSQIASLKEGVIKVNLYRLN